MIPKIIHYCWFGPNEPSPIIKKCIESWHKVMPDYEIKMWNEKNVPIQDYKFMRDAYSIGKWAFVSDYARYWILKNNGGIFLDCDVEALKPFDSLLDNKIFFAFNKHIKKNVLFVGPGLIIGVEKENPIITEILSCYDKLDFINPNGTPNLHYSSPRILTRYLKEEKGLLIKDEYQLLQNDIAVYPTHYFDPINPRKIWGNKLQLTPETYAIHHGDASWVPRRKKIQRYVSIILRNVFGDKLIDSIRGKENI